MSNNHCLVPAKFSYFKSAKATKSKKMGKDISTYSFIKIFRVSLFPYIKCCFILETLQSMRFVVYREETKLPNILSSHDEKI